MTRFKQLQQQSDFESLFWDDESCPLRVLTHKASSGVKRDDVTRHVDMLKVTQEREKEFFWQEAAASNLLAFLYLIIDDEESALEQLKLTLERAPNNLNAMVGMIRILEEQFHGGEAEKTMKQYRTLKEDDKEMEKQVSICQGEIAYACSFIGPDFYVQAIDRYEALLHPESKVWEMTAELNGYIVRWQYYLAYTYNRMLNKGNRGTLAEKLGTKDMRAIFHKIFKLYDAVIGSDDVFHGGKAMIDLVDAHKKCETSGTYQKIRFPYDRSPDQFVKDALDTAPTDPHVLERCGRHYRQRAINKKKFEETIGIFDSLLDIHPTRHVAWHHKGLACKALWHIVGKYREANLYNNSARKGKKKRVRKQKALACSETSHSDVASATAAECYQNLSPILLVPNQPPCESPVAQFQSLSVESVDEGFQSMPFGEEATGAQEIPSVSSVALRTAPRELPTLPPWKSQELGDVPRQLKKPDFFDKLRTSNPPVKDGGSRTYLEQAKKCFEEAKKITKGMCSPYIVDLARSLISLGLYDAAEREFNAAKKLASTMNNSDATYLYEQWALLRHSRASQEQRADEAKSKMKDVARLYRQAILSAVRARERSRMAFYNLRDLLSKELEHDADNEALKMEYSVLRDSVQNYSECKEMLVEALKKDEDTRNIAWHLIRLLRDRHHQHDAATAFMYLSALHAAGQLDLEESATTPDTSHQESNRRLLINVVRELVRDGDQTNADGGQTLGEIFRWMVGTRRISEYIALDRDSPRPFANSGEICVLAPCEATPGVDTVLRVLQDVCGVAVVRAFCEGNCDVRWDCPTSEGVRAVVAISQAVVVVEHSTDTDNWKQLFPILEELLKLEKVRVCLVADENTDCSNTEQRYVTQWSRLTINQNCDDVDLACMLLKTMFP